MFKLLRFVVGLVGFVSISSLGAGHAQAMGMEAFGPAGEFISRSPDWPKGVEDVLRHPARVYWRDVNGSEDAFYDGDIAVVNGLLEIYSQVDLANHPVVMYSGRPAARSFDGKKSVPYVVEFVVPGSFARFGKKKRTGDGVDLLTPRMIVHIHDKLAEHLGELKVPANVTLRSADLHGDEVAEQALQRRVVEFVEGHPQRARVPSPQELLVTMQNIDAEYGLGFTARGTRVEPALSGRGKLIGWTVTMGRDRLVVEQRDVEDEMHPKAEGRYENTNYAGPGRMGTIYSSRLWANRKLNEAEPQATFEPVGSTYDLLIGRFMWPLGRGFTSHIDRINNVTQAEDGLLRVVAESTGVGLIRRWELLVDPQADYLVCSAKAFREDETAPVYVVETAGIITGTGRSVAHTARWIEDSGEPVSIAVTSVSAKADEALIQRTEKRLDVLPGIGR